MNLIPIENKFRDIFAKQDGIVATYFFGSRVKGNTDKFSDYDLAVLFREGWNGGNRWNIIADLLGNVFTVVGQDNADVVDLSKQPLWFQNVVVSEGRVVYEPDSNARRIYEKVLAEKCGEAGLDKYLGDEKMRLQDVQIKLQTFDDNLDNLETLRDLDYDEFMGDFRNLDAAKHELQTSIEALIDMSRYVIKSLGLPQAEEYNQVPEILVEHGYLDKENVEAYSQIASFRNLTVHHYHKVVPNEIYNIVNYELDDLRRWRDRLVKTIETVK